jgi:outer membrane protein assembly factor BamD
MLHRLQSRTRGNFPLYFIVQILAVLRVPKPMKNLLILICAAAAVAGCGNRRDEVQDLGAEGFYDRGLEAMEAGNYIGAAAYFRQLEARYPFSNVTRQAQLDLIYLYYKSSQPEAAIDAAEEFERENPTHARVDYCLYMKGLVYFDDAPNILERLFRVDLTVRPPKDTLRAFSTFQELIRRFPDSRYTDDARQRMIFLRNRLANYENYVARYYIERGAYIAAVSRAKYALEHYAGAPELEESLRLMVTAYQRLGMQDLAVDAERVLRQSFGSATAQVQ